MAFLGMPVALEPWFFAFSPVRCGGHASRSRSRKARGFAIAAVRQGVGIVFDDFPYVVRSRISARKRRGGVFRRAVRWRISKHVSGTLSRIPHNVMRLRQLVCVHKSLIHS